MVGSEPNNRNQYHGRRKENLVGSITAAVSFPSGYSLTRIAPYLQAGGQGFESPQPHQNRAKVLK